MVTCWATFIARFGAPAFRSQLEVNPNPNPTRNPDPDPDPDPDPNPDPNPEPDPEPDQALQPGLSGMVLSSAWPQHAAGAAAGVQRKTVCISTTRLLCECPEVAG